MTVDYTAWVYAKKPFDCASGCGLCLTQHTHRANGCHQTLRTAVRKAGLGKFYTAKDKTAFLRRHLAKFQRLRKQYASFFGAA